jgi:hypothetical protein
MRKALRGFSLALLITLLLGTFPAFGAARSDLNSSGSVAVAAATPYRGYDRDRDHYRKHYRRHRHFYYFYIR